MSIRWGVCIVGAFVIAITIILFASQPQEEDVARLSIEGHTFEVLVADEQAERIRGLSGTPSLADGYVMLFVFPTDGRHGIWMKDMQFSIDVLWADSDGVIIHIERNIAPETYPHIFISDGSARYVIEMNAGSVGQLGIEVGQHMEAWPSG